MLILINSSCDDSTFTKYIKIDLFVKLEMEYDFLKISMIFLNDKHV